MAETGGGQDRSTREDQDHGIHARDVRPGMVVWNPYCAERGF